MPEPDKFIAFAYSGLTSASSEHPPIHYPRRKRFEIGHGVKDDRVIRPVKPRDGSRRMTGKTLVRDWIRQGWSVHKATGAARLDRRMMVSTQPFRAVRRPRPRCRIKRQPNINKNDSEFYSFRGKLSIAMSPRFRYFAATGPRIMMKRGAKWQTESRNR